MGWGERRYADHIFTRIYFRMHHFVVNFSKFSLPHEATGHCPPNQNPAHALGCLFESVPVGAGVKVDQGVSWSSEVISSQMLVQVPASTYTSPTSASQVRSPVVV